MTYWLVANPEAGDGKRGREYWLNMLQSAGIHNPECCDLGDQRWMKRVQPDDVVMVAGGDGSVNRGAELCLEKQATLAVLPSGTANDFARNLGLPDDSKQLCQLIVRGTTLQVDVAEYGNKLFLNVAHIGLGSVSATESRGPVKKFLGRFSYGIELLRRLGTKRGFHASVRCGGGVVQGRWLSIAVGSGAFFGGGNEMPETAADYGLLHVILVKPRPIPQLLMTFFMVRLTGKTSNRTSTIVHLQGRDCHIETRTSRVFTADGDEAGETPVSFECRAGCLRVIGTSIVSTGE
ncbi:diacylglycerol/lipid kinase family protein [Marinobacter sp. LV10MA510-1]|uniref:diacylglycerol/lipid kinase family protein n=1 Tax=Marinobacter sp. LV10MA510-1 TaxID=1415567 RepID=UPI000BF3F8EC|nr:diacylglycerol kinase family protein [Marinobacter sp. LV10MA510-1]PFG09670.1 YegS/Rv2252/BmrU family lipid kinase [Marinobacter sp. LV10MA510-1]